jgi:hypothetical protein
MLINRYIAAEEEHLCIVINKTQCLYGSEMFLVSVFGLNCKIHLSFTFFSFSESEDMNNLMSPVLFTYFGHILYSGGGFKRKSAPLVLYFETT